MAEKVIREDDPLLLCYGCLNNDLFLLDYGFVMQSNPYDCIELRYDGALLEAASTAAGVSSPNFSTPAPWQELILSQLNLAGEAPDLKVRSTKFLPLFLMFNLSTRTIMSQFDFFVTGEHRWSRNNRRSFIGRTESPPCK